MVERAMNAYRNALVWWVDSVRRRAGPVLLAAAAVTAAALFYTYENLGINTDTGSMLSKDLPFRQTFYQFQDAFPQTRNILLVVIEGENPDLVEDGSAALAARLMPRSDLYHSVYHPGGDRFFHENGLLFLDVEELVDLSDELAGAQPLLATLAQDSSLRGLGSILNDILEGIGDGTSEVKDVDLVFDSVAETITAQLESRHKFLSWKKMMRGGEVSREERRRFIILQPKLDFSGIQPAGAAIDFVRKSAAELSLDAEHGVRVRLTGSVALGHEEIESVSKGAGLAGLLSLILVAILLVVGLKSVRLVGATLITLIFGLIWTATFATLTVGHLNLMSVAFAVLFVGLGVDFGIHLGLRYLEEIDRGVSNPEALRVATAEVGDALTLCAIMAAVGFYSFIPTAYVGVSELGMISGTGMFVALFASVTILPAVLSLLPVKPRPRMAPMGGVRLAAIERAIDRQARKIVLGAMLLGIAGMLLALQARFDFNPLNLKDPETESVQTLLDLFADNDASPNTINFLMDSPEAAAEIAARLAKLPEVDRTITLADYVPSDQDEKLEIIDETGMFLLPVLSAQPAGSPTDREDRRVALLKLEEGLHEFAGTRDASRYGGPARLAAAISAFREDTGFQGPALEELEHRLFATLGKRLEILSLSLQAQPVTLDDLPMELVARQVTTTGRARVEVYPSEDISDMGALRRYVAAVRKIAPGATDTPVLLLEAGDVVVSALQQAVLLAVVMIAIALLITLRSVLDTVLVMSPVALAGVLTFAATVLIDVPFNFVNVIVLPLLLGLGVASGIHLVMRQRNEGEGTSLLQTSTPRAVLFSALTTVGSFGTLAISSHRGTGSMGLLLTIAIALTLLCTLVVLPAMLVILRRRRTATAAVAPTDQRIGGE